jgi:hypothetical protein
LFYDSLACFNDFLACFYNFPESPFQKRALAALVMRLKLSSSEEEVFD